MRILTGFLVTGATLAVSACGVGVTGGPAVTHQEDRSYELPQGQVAQLGLHLSDSKATIVGTDTTKIVVSEHLTYSKNRKPTPHHSVSGSELTLGYTCPRGINIGFSRCNVDYRIEVPRALKVDVNNDSGSLTLTGLAGAISAHADSGRISLTDFRGSQATLGADSGMIEINGTTGAALDLRASSGAVRAEGLKGGKVTAEVDSGSLRADFSTPPSLVDISVDSGSVHLGLPTTVAYNLDTKASSGSDNVDHAIESDTRSPNLIKVRTDSGSISIDPV